MTPEYVRTLARCDELIARASAGGVDELLVSATCQHICVLMAGALEGAVKEILSGYCTRKSAPAVGSYAAKRISTFQNADPEKILTLVSQFDSKWSKALEEFWADEVKDHIGSIVGNRHNIAHGRPTEVSIARIREWRRSLGKLIQKLLDIAAPD